MTADIIELFTLSCDDCINASFGPFGVFCTIFNEQIVYPDVANECNSFENISG